METTLQRRRSTARLVAPIACGCALAASAVYVAANDPTADGSVFPGCVFRQTTGLWCPGCGLTRGMHALLHGDVAAAVSANVFTPVVAVLAVTAWLWWTRRELLGPRPSPLSRIRAPWWVAGIGLLVLYGVLRNIPAAPFSSLAP